MTDQNLPDSLASAQFTAARIADVLKVLPQAQIIEDMAQALHDRQKMPAPQAHEVASMILQGEFGRVSAVGQSYWALTYEKPLHLLKTRRLIPPAYSVAELGMSLGIHWGMLDEADRPYRIIGIDNQPHIAAGARRVVTAIQAAGFTPANFSIIDGDHTTLLDKTDIAILSFVSQYEAGEPGALEWLMQHGNWGINGDVAHSRIRITEAELTSGKLPIRSIRNPHLYTGLAWVLDDKPSVYTILGQEYLLADAHLDFDANVINKQGRMACLPSMNIEAKSRVLIYRNENGLYYHGLGITPRAEADPHDVAEVFALFMTLSDVWEHLATVSQGKRIWDTFACLALPAYAAQRGYYTAMNLATYNRPDRMSYLPDSLKVILSILMRYRNETQIVYQANKLSTVGPDKIFRNLDEMYATARKWIAPASNLDNITKISHPIIATTITTANKDSFAMLLESEIA